MVFRRLGRHAETVSMSAGYAWVILSLLSLLTPGPARYLDVLFVVPYSLSLVGVLRLHAVQRDRSGQFGDIGFRVSVAGIVTTLVGQTGIIMDTDALTRIVLPVGVAAWILGFLLFGLATARAGVLPRWTGAAIALSQPLAVVAGLAFSPISPLSSTGDYSGAISHGLVWLSIGAAIRARGLVVSTGPAFGSGI
jgi:hypothetical protein